MSGDMAMGSAAASCQEIFPKIDTKDVQAVAAFTRTSIRRMHPEADAAVADRLFREFEDMFSGRYLDYLPIDMRYHDLEHTLQAAFCLIQLLEGRSRAGSLPVLTARQVEIAIASVLLHDSGYLKLRSDWRGTGAKYTFVHVIRSCAFAASYLPTIGFGCEEVDIVENAIRCTGPRSDIDQIEFPNEIGNFLGCALATADFLGQMAAPDYVDELPFLYAEFEESDRFFNLPNEKRHFRSARELIEKTPAFWTRFVLPRLTEDYRSVYRFLAEPYPDGANPYLDAVERNIARTAELIRSFSD